MNEEEKLENDVPVPEEENAPPSGVLEAEQPKTEEPKTEEPEASQEKIPDPDRERRVKERKRTLRALRNLLIKLAVVGLLGYLLLHYVFGIFVVHSNDMYPAVRDGDLVVTYRLADCLNGNIVSYTYGGARYFGRIVGVPGDVVEMDEDGHFTINGSAPYETVYYETRAVPDSDVVYPYVVGEGELFLLNDLRENTQDSRSFGGIPLENVDGCTALLQRHSS